MNETNKYMNEGEKKERKKKRCGEGKQLVTCVSGGGRGGTRGRLECFYDARWTNGAT